MNSEQLAVEIVVSGRVQGVGFRYFVLQQAQELGICGFTRNETDATVTTFGEGPGEALEEFIRRLSIGPRRAIVSDCRVQWRAYGGLYTDFSIHR